jgi:hypothetical protein
LLLIEIDKYVLLEKHVNTEEKTIYGNILSLFNVLSNICGVKLPIEKLPIENVFSYYMSLIYDINGFEHSNRILDVEKMYEKVIQENNMMLFSTSSNYFVKFKNQTLFLEK